MDVLKNEVEEMFKIQGQPLKPLHNQKDSLKHAGTLEETLVVISPPKTEKVVKVDEEEHVEINIEHHAG
jgi:hypothetical protein